MTYTIRDLDSVIEDDNGEWSGSWEDFSDDIENGIPVEIPGIGEAEFVLRLTGFEGQSEHGFIFTVSNDEGVRIFCRNGWYSSYGEDGEYDGPTNEVVPRQQLITVYDSI